MRERMRAEAKAVRETHAEEPPASPRATRPPRGKPSERSGDRRVHTLTGGTKEIATKVVEIGGRVLRVGDVSLAQRMEHLWMLPARRRI